MNAREGCILLNLVSGVGYAKYRALVRHFGDPDAVFSASEEELLSIPGIGPQLARKLAQARNEIDLNGELELAERCGVRIYTLLDEAYPEPLRNIPDPPLCLYVRGVLPVFGDRSLAVVGTRKMSEYGRRVTAQLTGDAAAAGMLIVSGLAFGVDTVAHTAAVEAGGITVAVLGGGLSNIQPQENVPLARRMVETGGAVMTEFPMRFPVSRTSFPRRNRIVAGVSRALLVTEAGERSGALITARYALEFGKEVFAVPGRVDNPQAKGCHRLLKEGAALTESYADIAEALGMGFLPGFAPGCEAFENGVAYDPGSTSDLSAECAGVLKVLRERGECGFETLREITGRETEQLMAELMQLELLLLIRRGPNQTYAPR